MKQQIILSDTIVNDLAKLLRTLSYDGLYLLLDTNTEAYCLPIVESMPEIAWAKKISIPSGDENKKIENVEKVWQFLSDNEASRKSIMIILGGGMLTDLGGFAAATFKRGMRFINIPTTLLGAVDAAVGGKTGFNFSGLKNEIGVFASAIAVLIDSNFFRSLDYRNILSGYSEMIKHALLYSSEDLVRVLSFDVEEIDYTLLNELLYASIKIKERIVEEDPEEQGLRKALNLGHTFGHAFESLSYEKNQPMLHGYAVAWGLIAELYLSFMKLDFNKDTFSKVFRFIKEHYGSFPFACGDYESLYELMKHDKKNESGIINFTLLRGIGEIELDQTATYAEIEEVLDFCASL
ncbi:3-dehydroquinate synthase [Bacteroidales bacterium OttesenSCG-928-I14]|nr:3-dehydroquinate synthase [Bacteroidales bacterium OttesenSCG-928-I14]